MHRWQVRAALAIILLSALGDEARTEDLRNIRTGNTIPNESYCDQPYIVQTRDGQWLCVLTTGRGREGDRGQHVVSARSADRGKTWSPLVDIEPSTGPEASWACPLRTPGGRVYVFYDYNGDEVKSMPGRDEATAKHDKHAAKSSGRLRVDMLGWYCFKYSDDDGRSWSKERYRLPVRLTPCDLGNQWAGKVQIFWGIDKPKIAGDQVFFGFTKLGRHLLDDGEGWLFRSDNILTVADPGQIHWQLLPEGDHGIRTPEFGSVQEEHNLVPMADGSLYCVYRTTTGYPAQSYSRDGGRTWSKPERMVCGPGGPSIKTPRACPKLWRTAEGKYLFWFHNHSGHSFHGRNPVWIAGGVEEKGQIRWSQPEILLYDPKIDLGMSYPDLVEQDGRYWVTETQKTAARVHEIDHSLLEGLWSQGSRRTIARDGLALEIGPIRKSAKAKLPTGLNVEKDGGFTLDAWISLDNLAAGQSLVDSRATGGKGLALTTTGSGAVRFELNDGKTKASWESDPELLQAGKLHHVVAIADAGPHIITFVIDGLVCNGGEAREYGWGRWQGSLGEVSGPATLHLSPEAKSLRVYRRYLRNSEAIGNFNAGLHSSRTDDTTTP